MDSIGKKVNLSQGIDELFRGTVGVYNAKRKIDERKLNPYNGGWLRYRKIYGEFVKDARPNKADIILGKTENSPYFEDFRNAFNMGTEKEFARQYILTTLTLASDYYREGYSDTNIRIRTMKQAFKQAQSTMKTKVNLLNPNKGSLVKKKDVAKKRALQFLTTLTKEQRKEIESLETQYWVRRRKYLSNLSKYIKEFNVPEMSKRFEWE